MNLKKDIKKTNKYAVGTMDLATNVICGYYKLPNTILKSKSRKRNVIVAKQFIILFSKKLLPTITMREVADYFGFANHSNIIYSLKAIEGLIAINNQYKHDYQELDKLLQIQNVSIELGQDVDDICYYINLNNIVSAKTTDGKAIIFSGFNKDEVFEALSLIPSMITAKKPRKHKETKLYILETNKENEQ
jgi:hypothetical protein